MDGFGTLAEGWVVWNEESDRAILVYRPDVFDSESFPAACLPTIYLTHGRRTRRPGANRPSPGDSWYVSLFLEPEVDRSPEAFETRERAVGGAIDLAKRFAAGEIDYRALYQVSRPDYLDRLDELTGRA